MCACKFKLRGNQSHTIDEIMSDGELVNAISNSKVVSKECFANKHPLSRFQWLYCVAPEKLNKILKPFDLSIGSYADVIALADMVEKGIDKERLNADLMKEAGKINLTNQELTKTDCVIFC